MSGRRLLLMLTIEAVVVLLSARLDPGVRLSPPPTMLSFAAAPLSIPAPLRLHAGIQPPVKIVDVTPAYPDQARAARVQGVVLLEVVIDPSGRVASVRVLRSIPMLDHAAIAAVRQWRFSPARWRGKPVPVVTTVTVAFTLAPDHGGAIGDTNRADATGRE